MNVTDSMLKVRAVNGEKQRLLSEIQEREGKHAKRGRGTYTAFGHVVRIMHDVSGQAKVTDLHDLPLRQEDVASRQVPVDTLRTQGRRVGGRGGSIQRPLVARPRHGHLRGAPGALPWPTSAPRPGCQPSPSQEGERSGEKQTPDPAGGRSPSRKGY